MEREVLPRRMSSKGVKRKGLEGAKELVPVQSSYQSFENGMLSQGADQVVKSGCHWPQPQF